MNKKTRASLTSEDSENMALLYSKGATFEQIGRIYGTTLENARRRVNSTGMPSRKNSQHRIYDLNQKAFSDPILNRSAMYWGGFLAADGYVNTGSNAITLTLGSVDEGHLLKFKRFLKSGHPIRDTVYKTKELYFHSAPIIEDLTFFGIHQKKSLTYDPPVHCIWDRDFWRGMVDGDGFVSEERGYARMGLCGSEMALMKFEHFAKNITNTNAGVNKSNNIKMLHLKGGPALDLMKYLYFDADENIRLDRKFDKVLNLL